MIIKLIIQLIIIYLIFYNRLEIIIWLIQFLQKNIIKYNKFLLLESLTSNINKISKYYYQSNNIIFISNKNDIYNLIKFNNNDIILIINGGGFICDDNFHIFIINKLVIKYPKHYIIIINYPKNINFDDIINIVYNIYNHLLLNKLNITHIYAHSAGASITLALSKYFKLPKIILISPYIHWIILNNNDDTKKDIILLETINFIKQKFNYNIHKYFTKSNITDIIIFVGENEILLNDIKCFCIDNYFNNNLHIIPNKIHGLPMLLLDFNFNIDIIY